MDNFLLTLGILGLLLVTAAAVWQSVVAWRRAMSSTRTLQIWQAMRRRGFAALTGLAPGAAREAT